MKPYEPPVVSDSPGVCRRCAVAAEETGYLWFPIMNGRSGVYHSGGEYGVTDCGIDATADHFRWPV